MVNWCELKTTKPDGKVLYHNAFATNHKINKDNVIEIAGAGRARWKIENENNNTLKTKGYHLTHNYGHGKQHLSSLLCSMIILALLFHTLLEVGDERYRQVREKLPRHTQPIWGWETFGCLTMGGYAGLPEYFAGCFFEELVDRRWVGMYGTSNKKIGFRCCYKLE